MVKEKDGGKNIMKMVKSQKKETTKMVLGCGVAAIGRIMDSGNPIMKMVKKQEFIREITEECGMNIVRSIVANMEEGFKYVNA